MRYGIRENESNHNLIEKFEDIKKKIEEEKNDNLREMKNKEIKKEIFSSAIKEEEEDEKSSEPKFDGKMKQKMSWASEDSVTKEKDNVRKNSYDGSLHSSGIKAIKENKIEEVINEDLKGEESNNNNLEIEEEEKTN